MFSVPLEVVNVLFCGHDDWQGFDDAGKMLSSSVNQNIPVRKLTPMQGVINL